MAIFLMLKRNWKILFVGISQLVDILAMICAALVVVWLHRYEHANFRTTDADLITGYIVFVVAYLTIAIMMGLYRGSFHLSLSLQIMIIARAFIFCVLVTLTIVSVFNRDRN